MTMLTSMLRRLRMRALVLGLSPTTINLMQMNLRHCAKKPKNQALVYCRALSYPSRMVRLVCILWWYFPMNGLTTKNRLIIFKHFSAWLSRVLPTSKMKMRARTTILSTPYVSWINFYKDYFLIFAHVEAPKGLWKELAPGRIKDWFDNATVRRRVPWLFQKVRTRDERAKIQQALGQLYPAEVEGCDAKNLADMSARKEASYLKLGSFSFEAVKFALRDKASRVRAELPSYKHSYIQKSALKGGYFRWHRNLSFAWA